MTMTRGQKNRTIKATRRRSNVRPPAIRQTAAGRVRRGALAHERLRIRKRYRMKGNIPEHIGRSTTAYAILVQIQKHKGRATFDHIQARLPKVPLPTIRFYLGKFQRDKIVAGA
jgi:hypothetical protein